MRGCLMLRMVPRMFGGLCLSEPTNGEHAQHQGDRKKPTERRRHRSYFPTHTTIMRDSR